MTELPTHKIIRLEAENVKRLKAVSITPDGNLIEITGRNRQGKSSLLDSIWWALTGNSNIQTSPIRAGEEKAHVTLDLGSIVVIRKFNAKDDGGYTTSVTVSTPDGMQAQKPQKYLDDLVGALSMDPLAFAEAKAEEQFETLKSFVPGFDFIAIEDLIKSDYADRTDVNRKLKDTRAQVAAIAFPDDTPEQPIDVEALTLELQQAGEKNADGQRIAGDKRRAEDLAERLSGEATRLDEQAAEYERLAKQSRDAAEQKRSDAAEQTKRAGAIKIPAMIDPSEITKKLQDARVINDNVAKRVERDRLNALVEQYDGESKALTKAIDDREEEKREAIAAAALPVEGIGFGAGFITLNGQPFDQASDAEQLEASIAIAIAQNPRLKVIRIRNGSLLDADAMKVVAAMADKHDCQVWIETVSSGRDGAFVIEDGELVEAQKVAAE